MIDFTSQRLNVKSIEQVNSLRSHELPWHLMQSSFSDIEITRKKILANVTQQSRDF